MLQPPHDDTVQRLLAQFQGTVLLEALRVHQSADKSNVEGGFISQTLDILGGVRIDVLERAGELIIEPLGKGHDAAGDLEDLARGNGWQLLIILPFLGILDNDNVTGVLEDLKQLL